MYDDEINGISEFDGISTEPFYMYLTASTWRMFIKYGDQKCDLESEKRLMDAARAVYDTLDAPDRELLGYYGKRLGMREESLAAYSYETNNPGQLIRKRFNYLCYLLAVQLHLINVLVWNPPPESNILFEKGKNNNEQ